MSKLIIFFLFITTLWSSERIITLSPAITEIVFALGYGDELIAVSNYSVYPEAAKKLSKVGGYSQPNLEKIISLNPTLVITQSYQSSLRAQLDQFGIETLSVKLVRLQDIKASIVAIAKRLDTLSGSKKLIAAINNAEENVPKAKNNPSVLIVFGAKADLRDGIYIAGHQLFFDDIITLCGAHNAFTSDFTGQPALTLEGVIALNPDIIIILYSPLTDAISQDEAKALWSTLPLKAAKQNSVHVLDASNMHIPSHRVAKTIGDLCEVIAYD